MRCVVIGIDCPTNVQMLAELLKLFLLQIDFGEGFIGAGIPRFECEGGFELG